MWRLKHVKGADRDMETFTDYAYYYNTFYGDKDYRQEAQQIDALLKRYGSCPKRIINFGCGTGKHDVELTKLGYSCTGIDMSPLMIQIAQENAQNVDISFMVADIRSFESKEKYDAVISLFHVMSYQSENEDILKAFHSARKMLDKGGEFVFDVWYGPGVLSDRPSVRVKEMEDRDNRLIRIARPVMYDGKDVVDVNYEILVINKVTGRTEVINETHKMRYFFRPEIEFFLKETDFELIDSRDCRTLGETDYGTWTSYFIAKAM